MKGYFNMKFVENAADDRVMSEVDIGLQDVAIADKAMVLDTVYRSLRMCKQEIIDCTALVLDARDRTKTDAESNVIDLNPVDDTAASCEGDCSNEG